MELVQEKETAEQNNQRNPEMYITGDRAKEPARR